ncbi:MAG: rpfG 15 [Firmicutes bacterium]|nr:rpfG 15 [Bacillota bacterium]
MSNYVNKRLAIDDLVPGMCLGKMIVTDDGKNFLNEGAVLTLRVIQMLHLWGLRYVDIREEAPTGALGYRMEDTEPLHMADADKKKTSSTETTVQIPAGFLAYYEAAVQVLKGTFGRARFLKDGFEITDVRQMVEECVLPLIEDPTVLDNIQMMPHPEDYLYHHSVDVGILSGCLGLWLGRPFRELEEIILGALLHDVGKALIPLKVLNKPGALTAEEMALMRFHSVRGYNFLKQNRELPRSILLCALQHHERMDGSGYPLSVTGDKIHPYAKTIAVADVFDAITSARNYGRKVTPYEAVAVLQYEMLGKLDSRTCSVLVDHLVPRFVGDFVELSNGQLGEVIFLNVSDSSRPTIRTIDGDFVDLDKCRTLKISKVLRT